MRFGLGKTSSTRNPDASTADSARVQRLKGSGTNRSFRVAPFHPTRTVTTSLPFAADFQAQAQSQTAAPPRPAPATAVDRLSAIALQIQEKIIERIDVRVANELEPSMLTEMLRPLVLEIASEDKMLLSQSDHSIILQRIVDELLGL